MKNNRNAFSNYLFISVFVTLVDIIVCYLFENFLLPTFLELNAKILIANTIGIIVGFTVQFFLAAKHVYDKSDIKTFVKFLLTFILGLFLQNLIVMLSRNNLFDGLSNANSFISSKLLSIVTPFFFIYYLRLKWIGEKKDKEIKGDVIC